jgi:hypothetical protein
MNYLLRRLALASLCAVMAGVRPASAQIGRTVVKGAVGRAEQGLLRGIWKREAARDARTIAKPLGGSLRVFRYTSREQAQRELAQGIAPGRHLTARAMPGRPPRPEVAQRRYGLPRSPNVRELVELPKGHQVRRNKAWFGGPGVGEITPSQRIAGQRIKRIVRLPQRPPAPAQRLGGRGTAMVRHRPHP